jgi:hypothetical protein
LNRIVPPEVAEGLGFYVYVLRDPRDGQVFYVGKGVGSRVFSHVREAERAGERAKLEQIRAIKAAGYQVEHLILRSGLKDEADAFVVEQAVMDGLTATGVALTNATGGHGSAEHGLSTVEAAIARLSAPQAPPVTTPTVMFIINRAWRADMSPDEIFQATRGHWRIGAASRSRVSTAMGVAYGVVRGVYRIESWYPSSKPGEDGRFGFEGHEDRELAGRFLGTSVRHLVPERGAQNPVRLVWPQ